MMAEVRLGNNPGMKPEPVVPSDVGLPDNVASDWAEGEEFWDLGLR